VESRPWHRIYGDNVPRSIPLPETTLEAVLRAAAARFPQRPAVLLGGPGFTGRLSYRALDRESDRFAHALIRLGIRPRDRVALALPNLPQYPIALYGTWKAAATAVQVNPLYHGDDLANLLADSGARVLVTLTRLWPQVDAVRSRTALEHVILAPVATYFPQPWRTLYAVTRARREGDARPDAAPALSWARALRMGRPVPPNAAPDLDDIAVLQYTGGTTGLPRGAMLSHRNLAANAAQGISWFVGLREGAECFLAVVPLFHAYGLVVLNAGIRLGATMLMVPMRMFDARMVAEQVPRHRPSVFPGVPAMYAAINRLKHVERYDLHSIRLCVSGAAELPQDVVTEFERITGGRLVEGYGLTEASPLVAANPLWQGGVRKSGSIGVPLPSTDVRIVDVETGTRTLPPGQPGELAVRGPQVMRGYWNAPDATAEAIRDGWLLTGDVGWMDEDGFFFLVDRKKDMINVGGLNVYPREIEEPLRQHPAVRQAAVVGVKRPIRGEIVVAYVVPKTPVGDPGPLRTELREYLRGRLPAYKVPRRITLVDEIPTTLIGKPLRRLLRDSAARDGSLDDAADPPG
jgi:long-chain acyl-CoA synthetase